MEKILSKIPIKIKNGDVEILDFNVRVLKMLTLWPENDKSISSWSFIKYYILILSLCPSSVPVFIDMIMQLQTKDGLINATDNITGLAPWFGMMYMTGCFMRNRQQMKYLVRVLRNDFNKFGSRDFVKETSQKASFYSKFFLLYCISGNFTYASIPLIEKEYCLHEMELMNKTQYSVSCGVIIRTGLPGINLNYSPRREMVMMTQMWAIIMITVPVLSITMFLCSLLMHLVSEILNLQEMLINVCENGISKDEMLRFIFRYSDKMRDAFSSMLLVHLTLTSFTISILGYEVVFVKTFAGSLRFALHLGGWLLILMLTCYFGQQLIDESSKIALMAYSTAWFNGTPRLRKDIWFIIMRSQRPLQLTAASMGSMSLETFLRVMSSAYSYFTLLLNVHFK
ncbi:odorant receptor 49b-like [Chrysoperla carnea]|uniref:odorant receptor 49b-like n=1 Tax=Chrysoperla carnea TaxID=189513 RepID=UPI001D075056|nr:odorant receptor 49b-like [Chrysoperla carnea]